LMNPGMSWFLLLVLGTGACISGASAPDAGESRDRSSEIAVDGARPDGDRRDASAGTDIAVADLPRAMDVAPTDASLPDGKPPLPQRPVLILAGQSNMVGLGYTSDLSAADKKPVVSTTIYYNDSVHPNPNTLKWMPLAPGFGVLPDRFGPELSFGRRLRQLWPQPPMALIKVAEGGTALSDRWAAKTGDLYQLLVSEVKQQLAVLNTTSQAQIVGLVWLQGESDGMTSSQANAYQTNLTKFVTGLRQDLNLPALPFTAGLISLRSEWPYAQKVRNATIAVTQALPPGNVVETADLATLASDPVHSDSASNLTVGRRFANAMASLHAASWSFATRFGPVQGMGGWSYRDRQGTSATNMIWDPKQNRWVGAQAGVFIGEGWMHPGPTHMAELVWTSPIAGAITVQFTVAAADNTGGDGTWAEIANGPTTIWGPTAIPNNTSAAQTLKLTVQQGSLLQFRTSAGPAQDPYHDTTSWDVVITPGP